nr:DUF4365 domain-containing protein [uncultured Allomuricauda sp.]
MAILPKVTKTYFSEREGVMKVGLRVNDLGYIFRETANGDVGIDGQIEFVNNDGLATGKIIAVQVKSGDSHLIDKGEHWAFYPKEKHKNYWELFPIAVILLLYSPSTGKIYFTDARHQLNIPNSNLSYIKIPKTNILNESSKEFLFESLGNLDEPFLDINEVLKQMVISNSKNPTFSMSYFHLFVMGITNIGRQLFFSMSLAVDIAENNNNSEFGLSVGPAEHDFLHDYVRFLVSQNLTKIDYADYLIDWKERNLQPSFLAPITQRGHRLMRVISHTEKNLVPNISEINLTMETSLQMNYFPSSLLKFKKAQAFVENFKV